MTASRATGQQLVVPAEVADRIRRPAPPACCVLPGSLPVVSFGDPNTALIATLSLNPSSGEFLDPNGHWLLPGKQHLPALAELRDLDPRELSHEQVANIMESCHDYFSVNPLKGFFGTFERLMQRARGR